MKHEPIFKSDTPAGLERDYIAWSLMKRRLEQRNFRFMAQTKHRSEETNFRFIQTNYRLKRANFRFGQTKYRLEKTKVRGKFHSGQ